MSKSGTALLLKTLEKNRGENAITVAQAQKRFGITNVTGRIAELRDRGYRIYTNFKTNKATGRKIATYKLAA